MKQNDMTSLKEILEQLTTEQLDEMLHAELKKDPVEDNSVRLILRILKEREADHPEVITPGVEKAWEKYQRDTAQMKSSRKVRSWMIRATSVAAILCLLVLVFPQEARAESFWERLSRWTESIVEFFSPNDNEGRLAEYKFMTDNPGLQQIYDAVVEMGVTDPVVPMWLPEEYELVELVTTTTPRKIGMYSRFGDVNGDVTFSVDVHSEDVSHAYCRDDSQCDTYEQNGFIFYIMRNNERWAAIWTKSNIECSIYIDCQEDTLYRILRSIYIMEDE